MKRKITIRHIASRLDVHPSTISLGLRNSHHVSKPLQRRIHALARRLRYAPNHIARCLRRCSTKTLGVVFPYATAPYYATLLDALYAETLKRGYHLEVCFHQWNPRDEIEVFRTLLGRQVEGLIVLPASRDSFRLLRECVPDADDLPVATLEPLDAHRFPSLVRGCVFTDMYAGSLELGRHLLEMGHRHIALLVPARRPTGTLPAPGQAGANLVADRKDRVKGLQEALGLAPGARLEVIYLDDCNGMDVAMANTFGIEGNFLLAQQLAERFLELAPRPTAAVASNEAVAHGLLASFYARGCRVPDEVSVACYDGTFLSEYGAVPLTCVKQPLQEMARNLVELAIDTRSQGGHRKPEIRILQPTLALRRSVVRVQVNK
ncbi:MAG: LacI family DNA-binding transcriptional regulator [Verrucomicrobia bacterium]|nr:LacI family DNA-binding transcriptional regulator [Verrucomicrobiota bacterium]